MEYRLSQRQSGLLPLGLGLLAALGLGLALALPPTSAKAGTGQTLEGPIHLETSQRSASAVSGPVREAEDLAKPSEPVPLRQTALAFSGDLAAPAKGQGPLEALLSTLVQETMKEGVQPGSGPVFEPLAGHEAALYLMVCCVEPTGERILGEDFSIPTPEGPMTAQSNDRGSACLGPLAPGRYTLESSLGTVVFTLAENGAVYCTDPLCRMDGEYITLGFAPSS